MEEINMSLRAAILNNELRNDISSIEYAILSLPEIRTFNQEDLNNHLIVRNLCKAKLNKVKDKIKELRLLSIAIGMYNTLGLIDSLEGTFINIERNNEAALVAINALTDINITINNIGGECET